MSRTRGCLGNVSVGATPTLVGEVRSYNADEQAAIIDGSAMGSCDAVYDAGPITTTGSIGCWFDKANAGQVEMIAIGIPLDIIYQPEGVGSTLAQEKLTAALITGRTVATEVAGNVEVTFSFQGGAVDKTPQT